MRSEEINKGVAELYRRFEEAPEDRREIFLAVRERMSALKARGQPVPEPLARLHRDLMIDFCAESQGR